MVFKEYISPYWHLLLKRVERGALFLAQIEQTIDLEMIRKKIPYLSLSELNDVENTRIFLEQAYKALQKQIYFSVEEQKILPYEDPDPLGARFFKPISTKSNSRIIHQYKNRCLFIVNGNCFAHCRYCFRRASPALHYPVPNQEEIATLSNYLKNTPALQEILLTGGDPLTLSNDSLEYLLTKIRIARPDILIRIGTRAPVFSPQRINRALIKMLKQYKPLWIIPHINHPIEISQFAKESKNALTRILKAGISMQSQTVLLRGVNDSIQVLKRLFNDITALGIRPGYLFHPDLVPGTAHFRISLKNGLDLYTTLRTELSGLSTPVYAVDLPNGGGKLNLLEVEGRKSAFFDNEKLCVQKSNGKYFYYPIE